MRFRHLLIVLVLLALAVPASPVHASGVVSVCDEAHLLAALSGGGTVTFTCSGTITLTNPITIAANTTVDGSGQAVTISGNNAVQVFYVNTGVTLSLKGLTIANGNGKEMYTVGGGGVETWGGTVNIDHSTFTGNTAYNGGAVFCSNGTVTISHSTFTGNTAYDESAQGGAIMNWGGTLTVTDSTFSANGAVTGGAIYGDGGTLTVSRSTFSGNTARDWSGGAIVNLGMADVSNSTFYDNSARNEYGGAIANGSTGQLTVTNGTFYGNAAWIGASIYNDDRGSTALLQNTIAAYSTGGGECRGTIIDGGGNLSYPEASCFGINQDPLLGPLQDNGGPTLTMAPGPGSPAIDAAVDAICAAPPVNGLDQRGVARPQGWHCDIGAVEQGLYTLPRPWPIDIKPGSDPNSINCGNAKEVIAVAILTTDGLDATTIDHATVVFEGATETHVNKKTGEPTRHVEDVDGDGDMDLVLHFRLGDTHLTCGSTEAMLVGMTFDGRPITGADYVRMVGRG